MIILIGLKLLDSLANIMIYPKIALKFLLNIEIGLDHQLDHQLDILKNQLNMLQKILKNKNSKPKRANTMLFIIMKDQNINKIQNRINVKQ